MKVKASITLSKEMLRAVDRIAGKTGSRSAVIEQAVREFLTRRERQLRDADDLAAINRHADDLNREASVFDEFQEDW